MSDITMCPGDGCHGKEECYRYKATPNPFRQSYFTVAPFDELYDMDGTFSRQQCGHFWPLEEEES